MAIAKDCEESGKNLRLFYGNRSLETTIFKEEIDALQQTKCTYYLSDVPHEDHEKGQISKEAFSAIVKADLDLLKADCFFICGPEQMIMNTAEVLELFGVANHIGNAMGGHYYAYIKGASGKWYEFNDTVVRPIKENEVVSQKGYVFFYRKKE